MSKSGWMIVAAAALLGGCSGSWLPWGRSDAEQPRRLPEGAVQLACDQNKRLVIRPLADGKSTWVHLPDREFRLDRAGTSTPERYSNGPTSLTLDGEVASLDIDGVRQYGNCKRPSK